MGPPSYTQSVVYRNVVMRCTPLLLSRLRIDNSSSLIPSSCLTKILYAFPFFPVFTKIAIYLIPLDVVTRKKPIFNRQSCTTQLRFFYVNSFGPLVSPSSDVYKVKDLVKNHTKPYRCTCDRDLFLITNTS